MIRIHVTISFFIVILNLSNYSFGQKKDSLNLSELSFEELMNLTVTVASNKALTPRESPSIISIITEAEIKNMGARELTDVLRTVPGFDFIQDAWNVLGPSVRGYWGQDGRVLIMVDGIMLNEMDYGGFKYNMNIPLELVKQIEIIRGPGSSKYGGFAALAVINIITKTGDEINGVSGGVKTGVFTEGRLSSRNEGNLAIGRKINDLSFDFQTAYSQGNVSPSVLPYQYLFPSNGKPYNMRDSSRLSSLFGKFGVRYKDLNIIFLGSQVKETPIYNFGNQENSSGNIKATYNLKISNKLTLLPKFDFKYELPWFTRSKQSNPYGMGENNHRNKRYLGEIAANYDFSEKINLYTGVEAFSLTSKYDDEKMTFVTNSKNKWSYSNVALFAQILWKNSFANITAGIREEINSIYGNSFVPRFAITKVYDKFHIKAMYAESFRAPLIMNIQFGENIKPERFQNYEIESGFILNKILSSTISLFKTDMINPLFWTATPANPDGIYANQGKSGVYGADMQIKVVLPKGYFDVSYSYYKPNNNDVPVFQIYDSSLNINVTNMFVGSSNHRLTFKGNYKITKYLSINPSAYWWNDRWAYYTNYAGEVHTMKIKSLAVFNLYFNYKELLKGLDLGFGVYNLLDETYLLPEAYNGGFSPIRYNNREIMLRIQYTFSK